MRRARGEGGLHWDDRRKRWIATTTIGYDGRGKRVVRKAAGQTKTEAKAKLRELLRDQSDGLLIVNDGFTVREAVNDWLAYGLSSRDRATRTTNRLLCESHIMAYLGARRVRDLTAAEIDAWLAQLALRLSTRTLQAVRSCLSRSIRRAVARDRVKRNVVELSDVPTGRAGRPSKALAPQQAHDVLTLTTSDRLYPYIVVSLLTGARTEELRALDWQHVHLETRDGVPAHVEVWRSVRSGGDTKTRRSRRTLALPALCVEALKRRRQDQAAERATAGTGWKEHGLVFTTLVGTPMDAANVRRDLRRALRLVPSVDPDEWTPRELRHSFVSLLSDAGMPLEEISRLVGHSGTSVTELVYRHQIRPVVQTGARLMDAIFGVQTLAGS